LLDNDVVPPVEPATTDKPEKAPSVKH